MECAMCWGDSGADHIHLRTADCLEALRKRVEVIERELRIVRIPPGAGYEVPS